MVRRNLSAEVLETGLGAYHRVRYELPHPPPSVSVIIPTKDRIDLLSVCLKGLLDKTSYANFEILVVDNNSAEARTFEYFEMIEKNERVRVLKFPGEFNNCVPYLLSPISFAAKFPISMALLSHHIIESLKS